MLKKWRQPVLAALVFGAASAFAWAAVPPNPGMLNYVEGRATLDGQLVQPKAAGTTAVEPGQVLATQDGRAEVLLTPGVFLRLGHDSAVRMISPGLTDTRVDVLKGEALVEAGNLHKENRINIRQDQASTTLLKNGLYAFNADRDTVAVFDGKASVQSNDQQVEVKGGREVNLNAPLKAKKFDKKALENSDPLYNWSKVRSEYLSEASAQMARTYVVNNSGWYGSGWYWDPWWHTWSFLPGAGVFYSPFGGAFYSPWALYGGSAGYYYRPHYRIVPSGPRYSTPRAGINPGVLAPRGRMNGGGAVAPRARINPGMGGRHR
jgi:hypothetical protein